MGKEKISEGAERPVSDNKKGEEKMASTRCKFRCNSVMEVYKGSHTVSLSAAYAPDDPESENGKFWTATPAGNIQLQINNPAGAAVFEQGKDYYVDFTPAG